VFRQTEKFFQNATYRSGTSLGLVFSKACGLRDLPCKFAKTTGDRFHCKPVILFTHTESLYVLCGIGYDIPENEYVEVENNSL